MKIVSGFGAGLLSTGVGPVLLRTGEGAGVGVEAG